MNYTVTFFIIKKYLKRKKNKKSSFTSFLSIFGIILGISSLIIVNSVINGFEDFAKKKILHYIPHTILTTNKLKININQYPKKKFQYLKGIRKISEIIKNEIILQSKENITLSNILALDRNLYEPLINNLKKKEYELIINKNYNTILDFKLAEELKIKKNDKIKLIVPDTFQFTPIGKIPSQKIFTVVGFFTTELDSNDNKILINKQDAQKLMHYSNNEITGWRLYFSNPLKINKFSKQFLPKNIVWNDWREEKYELFQSLEIENKITFFLFSLIVVVALFNIFISFSFLVINKCSDIAILKTLGMNNFQIILIFIIYGMKNIIFGIIIGILLGIILTKNINFIFLNLKILDEYIIFPVLIDYFDIFFICLIIILISLIGIFFTSYCSLKFKPIEILRYE